MQGRLFAMRTSHSEVNPSCQFSKSGTFPGSDHFTGSDQQAKEPNLPVRQTRRHTWLNKINVELQVP
eukprot:1149994-Pelagomonas_calceolata.AAC.6